MPVPKKRQSKSRKNSRKFTWKQKASKQCKKAFSKANLVIRKKLFNFKDFSYSFENDNNSNNIF